MRGFLAAVPRKRNAETRDALREALETLEAANNGRLLRQGLRHMLTVAGDKLSASDVDEVFRDPDIGINADGVVNKNGACGATHALSARTAC